MKEIKKLSDLQSFENKVVVFKKHNQKIPALLFDANKATVFDFAIIYSHEGYNDATYSIETRYTMNFLRNGHGYDRGKVGYIYLMGDEDVAALTGEMRLANRKELLDIQEKIKATLATFNMPSMAGPYWHFGLVAANDALEKINLTLKTIARTSEAPIYPERNPSPEERKLHAETTSWCGIGFGNSES